MSRCHHIEPPNLGLLHLDDFQIKHKTQTQTVIHSTYCGRSACLISIACHDAYTAIIRAVQCLILALLVADTVDAVAAGFTYFSDPNGHHKHKICGHHRMSKQVLEMKTVPACNPCRTCASVTRIIIITTVKFLEFLQNTSRLHQLVTEQDHISDGAECKVSNRFIFMF